jgi:AraC-like DNA-binding protein
MQVGLALSGTLTFEDRASARGEGTALIIPPDAEHRVAEPCERALLLFVDGDDSVSRVVATEARACGVAGWLTAATALSDLVRSSPSPVPRLVRSVNDALALPNARPRPHHAAVRAVLDELPRVLEAQGDVRIAVLAQRAALSQSRLAHLFSAEVGIPLRPYILWLRLRRALRELKDGSSITAAAHSAGFSDGAHFSNTFRRVFGLAPSDLTESVEWIEMPPG